MNSRPPWGGTYARLVRTGRPAEAGVVRRDHQRCAFVRNFVGALRLLDLHGRGEDNSLAAIDAGTTTWNHGGIPQPHQEGSETLSAGQNPPQRPTWAGAITLETRRRLLDNCSRSCPNRPALISDHEVRLIREQWEKDQTQEILWEIKP